jgi:hypothetical protein
MLTKLWRAGLGNVGRRRLPEASVNGAQGRYEAVAVRPHRNACKPVRALAGKRFLVAEAPILPLKSCPVHCRCSYAHYADRRQSPRRWADLGVTATLYLDTERRRAPDRRAVARESQGRSYYEFMRKGRFSR